MKEKAKILLPVALIAIPALASFHLRLPGTSRTNGVPAQAGVARVVEASPSSRPDLARAPLVFPEGVFEAAYKDDSTGAVFARYSCGLQADAALAAASRALAAAGWREVFSTASISLFENGNGKCAAASAIMAPNGATCVGFLVQE